MANEFIVKNGFKSQGDSEVTGSFTATSGMSGSFSGSFQGDGSSLSNVSLPAGVVSGSAQISYTGITDVPSGIVSSSAQIASDISGSFGAASASFSTRVTTNETDISTLTAATASYLTSTPTLQQVTDQGASTTNTIVTSADITASGDISLPTNASYIRFNNAEIFGRTGGSYPGLHLASGQSSNSRIWLGDLAQTTGAVTMSFLGGNNLFNNINNLRAGANRPLILQGGSGPNDVNDGVRIQTGDASNVYQTRFEIEADGANVDAYFTNINGLGINDSTPTAMLDVNGNINTTSDITASGDISAGTFTGDGSGITGVISASYAVTASYVETAQTASYVNTLSQQVVISDSTTSELLRITQTGTGDAIRIEDTSNPDATPTVINNAGDMFIGSSSAPQSGGGNSPKLYVKNGSSGYTGNLAIDTAMLFEGNGSTYFATLSPDNSFGGLYMGSPSDVFGAFIRWRHDDARLQLGAAKTNHGIEFTVGNKGATSMQLKPDATGTGDYNATLTVTGSLIVSGSNSSINTTTGILYDGSSVDSVRYAQRGLFSSTGNLSLQYDQRKLYNTDGTTIVFDWTTGDLNDTGGTLAVDLGERTLNDRFGNEIASWNTTAVSYFSASLVGTASYADNATSASYASTASFLTGTVTSASYAISASHLIGGGGGSDPAININANGTTLTEVTSDSDLPTTLAANTTYLIRGNVATGKTLNVTNAGTSVIGIGRNQSHLSYTGSNELFNVHDQSFSIKSLTMKSSGSIMTAKNVTPGAAYNDGRTKVLDIKDCQVKNTNNVMEVHGFELVDLNNVLFWYITGSQGLSFQSVRHLEISSCEFYNWYDETDTGSFAPAGTKMVEIRPNTGSVNTPVVNINSSIFHPEQSQVGLYIDSGSETLFGTVASNTFIDVNGGTLLGGSTYDSSSMLKYDVGINQGLEDSKAYLYGYQNGTDAQSATTTYTQITIADFQTNIETRMSASLEGVVYIGSKPIDVMFQVSAGLTDIGSNNEQFDIALYKNTTLIPGSERRIELDSNEEGAVTCFALTNIVQDDLLTVYQKSPTNDGFTLQNFAIMIKE